MIRRLSILCLILAGIALSLAMGREIGIQHAISESEIYLSDDGIMIDLDGNTYIHNREF